MVGRGKNCMTPELLLQGPMLGATAGDLPPGKRVRKRIWADAMGEDDVGAALNQRSPAAAPEQASSAAANAAVPAQDRNPLVAAECGSQHARLGAHTQRTRPLPLRLLPPLQPLSQRQALQRSCE